MYDSVLYQKGIYYHRLTFAGYLFGKSYGWNWNYYEKFWNSWSDGLWVEILKIIMIMNKLYVLLQVKILS